MSIYQEFRKRKAVKEFDTTAVIPQAEVDLVLRQAWKVTPSKNNFQAYNVHVLGPSHQHYKNLVYENCLFNEGRADGVDASTRYSPTNKPFYSNILSCSYLLIFSMRLEDQPNRYHLNALARGHKFEAFTEQGLATMVPSVSLEVGMFSDVVGGLCMERGWAVSSILCFPTKMEYWTALPFLTRRPILLMPIGKALVYKGVDPRNRRPNYERIVKFVE